jgi:hypothetical protein
VADEGHLPAAVYAKSAEMKLEPKLDPTDFTSKIDAEIARLHNLGVAVAMLQMLYARHADHGAFVNERLADGRTRVLDTTGRVLATAEEVAEVFRLLRARRL